MNYVIVNSVCCCLSLCCKQVWESLYRIIGKTAFIKFAYLLIYFSAVFLSVALMNIMNSSWSWVATYFAPGTKCQQQISSQHINCMSAAVVYRISFSLFSFSILMISVMLICSSRVSLIINQGLFFSKFVLIMIIFVITLQIDNQIFMLYGNLCKLVSYIFLLTQSVILIDLAYLWGIDWAQKYLDNQKYAIPLIGTTLLMFAGAIVFIVLSFTQHWQGLRWAHIICLLQIITVVGVQLLNFNKQNSLLTTSSLSLLIAYCTWSSGFSYPSAQNISQLSNETILYVSMGVSIALLLIASAGSIYGSTNKQEAGGRFIDLDNLKQHNQTNEQRVVQLKNWMYWIFYLLGLSAYIAMIITDWGSADIIKGKFQLTTGAWVSKLLLGNSIFFLYVWTLLAPRLCPNRNFYFQ